MQQPLTMHAPNPFQRVHETGSGPRLINPDDLLETATDLCVEILDEEPANDEPIELSSSDLEEHAPRLAVVQRGLSVRPSEATAVITTADLDELVRDNPGLTPDETVLFYCRAGESLPPYARHAAELPRFASTKMAPRPAARPRVPARLPSFSLPDRVEPSAVRRRRIPEPKLPKFIP